MVDPMSRLLCLFVAVILSLLPVTAPAETVAKKRMIAAANEENRQTEIAWDKPLPSGIRVNDKNQLVHGKEGHDEPFHAGRLTKVGDKLVLIGVLDKNECDHLIETSG